MKNKGFTLIELLAVIVVLGIVAVIATPLVLNTIEESKKGAAKASAISYIKAIESKATDALTNDEEYEDKEDYVYDEIEVDIKGTTPTGGIYSLKSGIVTSGAFCIDGYEVRYVDNKTEVQGKCTGEDLKLSGNVKLSETIGYYTYPLEGTFEVIENISGGALSCTSSDEEVAACSIEGTTVTVVPGAKEGVATLTIKSEGSSKYKEAQAAYVATTKKGLLSYTVNGYSGAYDGASHGITVQASGATIRYGTSDESYILDSSPTYTDVGEYTVYYEITKVGYNTITGSKTVVITRAEGSVTAPTAKTLTYTGSAQELINLGSTSTGTIQYKLEGGTYSADIPVATDAGTYKVYYKVVGDKNHNDVEEASVSVTIGEANNTLTLSATSGSAMYGSTVNFTVTENTGGGTLSVSSSNTNVATVSISGTTITITGKQVGSATITVTSEETNNYNSASVEYTVTINRANNTLTLSSNTGSYTYPTSGTFTVTENTSGGTLSCESDNSAVATCSISGTTVTVTPGTTEGTATLTIKSAETTNYKEAQASYVATTSPGILSYTVSEYTGVYDGASHGITVTSSGATIKYGTTSGTYNLDSSPTYSNAGTYTVYYQVAKAGYKTVSGSSTVTILKADGKVSLAYWFSSITSGNSHTFTITENKSGGALSVSSSNTSVATVSLSGTLFTVTAKSAGSTIITVTSAATTNYNAASYSATLGVAAAVASNTVNGVTTYYSTLNSAFNASTTGTTTLLSNTTENLWISSQISKTLNLNGKTLTGVIVNNNSSSSLTINGSGTLTNSTDRVIYNTGTMNINNATISGSYTGFSENILNTSTGQMTFNSCTMYKTATPYIINNANSGSFVKITAWNIIGDTGSNAYSVMNGKFIAAYPIGSTYEVSVYGAVITSCPTWSDANGQDDIVWHGAASYANYYYCNFSKYQHGTGSMATHLYNQSTYVGAIYYTIN